MMTQRISSRGFHYDYEITDNTLQLPGHTESQDLIKFPKDYL